MLDFSDSFNAALNLLNQQDGRVEVPADLDDFFEPTGPLSQKYDDQRRFPRYYYRKRAILGHNNGLSRVFTVDLSREGISFIHSRQLFPLVRIQLWVEASVCMNLEITRCRRIGDRCFECGARVLSKECDKDVEASELPGQVEGDEPLAAGSPL